MSKVAKGYIEYDGKRIEVDVTNLEISYDHSDIEGLGDLHYRSSFTQEIQISGRIVKMGDTPKCWWGGIDCAKGKDQSMTYVYHPRCHGKSFAQEAWWKRYMEGDWEYEEDNKKEEETMCNEDRAEEKSCGESSYYGGERLSQKINSLGLNADERKLRKYGLVDATGLVTDKGSIVLRNHLMSVYGEDIVKDLEALEESEEDEE